MDAGVVFSFILCVALGITIVFQALLNSHLGQVTSLNSYSALMSFLVGIPPVLLYFLIESRGLTHGTRSAAPWSSPWWPARCGYITVIIFTVQRIGAASVLATVVASQVAASIVVDHFAILGVQQHTATAGRIAGTVLIIAGSILVGIF